MSASSKSITRGRTAVRRIARKATAAVDDLAGKVGKRGARLKKQAVRQAKAVRKTAGREVAAVEKTARKEIATAKRKVAQVGRKLEKKVVRVKKQVRVIEGIAGESAAKVGRAVRRM